MTKLRQRMLEDLQIRHYVPTTVDCCVRSVAEFAQHFNRSPDKLGPEEIRQWQLYLLNEKKVKRSTFIQAVCGLRFFYRTTLNPVYIERFRFRAVRKSIWPATRTGSPFPTAGFCRLRTAR